ncbi:AAA family ATPase [Cellulophaga baltica]|uniref:AAA family ATPase n=1 Tax=Cellulophaga baltica TaxID=76594 RepID=UPI0024943E1D|nr:AAA family ATPase [Cellulophaga baltica]
MNLDTYENWLVRHDNKTQGSAYSYKTSIPKITEHYSKIKGETINFFKISETELENIVKLYGLNGKEFLFGDKSKGTYRNSLNALLRYRTSKENLPSNFTWVETHLELVEFLKNKNEQQPELINLLKSVGVVGFNDKVNEEENIELQEIDPFTFFCYIYKYGPERRLKVLQEIAEKVNLNFPEDDLGIPSSNAQSVWLFPYKYQRLNNEINRLWNFFFKALNNTVSDEDFEDILAIHGVAKAKLSEALFNINPKKYFPINGPTKPYLKGYFNIDPNFKTYAEYKNILKQLKQKSNKPFYQLSYEAWLWTTNDSEFKDLSIIKKEMNKNEPLNQIFYGPPGTGKTYHTIGKAIAIVNPTFDLDQERAIVKEEYKRLVDEGQIVFTTFHQSMAYEDFVEGIKPILNQDKEDVSYEIQEGIFKTISEKAKGLQGDVKESSSSIDFRNCNYFKMSIGGKNRKDVHDWCISKNKLALGYGENYNLNKISTIDFQSYKDEFIASFPDLVENSTYSITATHTFKNVMKKGDIVLISLGNHIIDAIGVVRSDYEYIESSEIRYHQFRDVEWIATDLDANPNLFVDKNVSQQTIYKFDTDDIKIDYLESLKSNANSAFAKQNHVLIIDEINRGNVSAIFGELITLLEPDKRIGADEELKIRLPYSKEDFGVPANLHIIGTMNTADRSVEALDTALRRRFEFKEMMPDYEVIKDEYVEDISLSEVLKIINQRIELLIDRDHTIGHSYFVNVDSTKKLTNAFNNKIVPLLQEYFYGDYGKIGLVLGKGFIEKVKNDSIEFATFEYDNASDFKTTTYHLKEVSVENIIEAVHSLLSKKDETPS